MKEYTPKQIKKLEANPYTLKVTKNKLYFTIKFKEDFWINYQAGNAPRKILSDLGYDLEYFGQKQIDSIVQRIKKAVHYFLMRKIYGVFHISRSIVQVTWLSFQN